MSRRVVVTGMGAVTPIGNNVKDFWENVKKGTVGIGPITKFDTTDYKAHLAAEVKDFDPTIAMDKKSARRMEDFAQYAVVAAKEALDDKRTKSCGSAYDSDAHFQYGSRKYFNSVWVKR